MKILFNPEYKLGRFNTLNPNFAKQNATFISQPNFDSISFSGNIKTEKINVDKETAEFVANSLSTSTSGHRAIYGSKNFTPEIVELITLGVAKYAKDVAEEKDEAPMVIIGGDTREATKKSLPLIKDTLTKQGVSVFYIDKPVPTPLLAYATQKLGIDIGILLTASHNPWEDGGFNLVTSDGAIAPPEVTQKVAKNMLEIAEEGKYTIDKTKEGVSSKMFPYEIYKDQINSYDLISWDNIKDSGISIYYDGLKGTGENVFPKLLQDYEIPYNQIKSSGQEGPNPTSANLLELKNAVKKDENTLKIGLSNDGDADRFGIIDEKGNFITPNDVILLVAYHLAKNKGMTGDIIRSQATTSQLDIFAKNNGLNVIQTPVGFKYIGEDIIDMRKEGKDILVAGEESGGLTIGGHIPEKDGIIALLLILDLVATEQKPLSQILEDTKKNLNTEFRAYATDKKFSDDLSKLRVMNKMQQIYNGAINGHSEFFDFKIDLNKTRKNAESMERYKEGGDGVKLYFTDGSSLLVRQSGTEPKVKAYIETSHDSAQVADETVEKLKEGLEYILNPRIIFEE